MQRADLDLSSTFRPPRSDVEHLLSRLMAEALELDSVGIDDDFFQLGGDSLSAENLFLAIEIATGRRLPISILYDRPTVRLLAEALAFKEPSPNSVVVKIRSRGSRLPVFIVPGIGGEVAGMEPLARHLDRDLPIYCCNFPGFGPGQTPSDSIEEIASSFLPEIRRMQPNGPYHLLGACFGGLVALEMAQRLRAEGAEVALLCLVDTPFPPIAATYRKLQVTISVQFALDRVRAYARGFAGRPGQRLDYVRSKTRHLATVIRQRGLPPDTRAEIAKRRVVAAHRAATRRYVPRLYDGSVLYVRSRDRAAGPSLVRRDFWNAYFPAGLITHAIACRDSGELFAHHADELARIVSQALRQPASSGR